MTSGLRTLGILALVAAVACVAGCAGHGIASDPALRFAVDVPSSVSSAWREGEAVWLVPARRTFIRAVTDAQGNPVRLEAAGSYLRIVSSSKTFTLEIDGRLETLAVP